jgi:hypothetical protein
MRIKKEGLQGADDVENRHCNLVPQPKRRYQEINEIKDHIRSQPNNDEPRALDAPVAQTSSLTQ